MGDTGIEWTDRTWNPVQGCTRVSEGCRNCYAETMAGRIVAMGRGKPTKYDGLVTHKLRVISDDEQRRAARWTGEVAFDAEVLAEPLKRRKATTYFVNSMSDLFHAGFTDEQIAAVFGVMAACPQHRFIVLTKRAQRMKEWFGWMAKESRCRGEWTTPHWRIVEDEARDALSSAGLKEESSRFPATAGDAHWPLPNVILGVSVENQSTADERIPHLLATPAAVRMVSAEPLLGPLDLRAYLGDIDWVIAGCESGRGARPCEVDWLRSLRDQCVAAKVPFFLKQAKLGDGVTWSTGGSRKPGGIISLPYLDGVQWAQMPEGCR